MAQQHLHKANARGEADHGWLKSYHSFSFATYRNPDRMGFGALRVLNDDVIQGGTGFDTHPHENMEIVSIPLSGALSHKDSEGNQHVIQAGEVHIMSAGTGISHSEYNHSQTESANFLQIWIIPEKKGTAPRYDQKAFDEKALKNKFQVIVSPLGSPETGGVKFGQQAYFSMASLDTSASTTYHVHRPGSGVYFFMIKGSAEIAGQQLDSRDALGLENESNVAITAAENSRILAIEVPMTW